MAYGAAGDEGAVVAAFFCFFGGKVAFRAVGELYQEGLLAQGPGLDLVAVVQEQLKGVGGKGHGAHPDHMDFSGEILHMVLQFHPGQNTQGYK